MKYISVYSYVIIADFSYLLVRFPKRMPTIGGAPVPYFVTFARIFNSQGDTEVENFRMESNNFSNLFREIPVSQ